MSTPRSAKSTPAAQAAFRGLLPGHERVTVRPMFGSLAAFANGYMFMGLFADELFFRLDQPATAQVLAAGGGPLEPMPGRPMRDYVVVAAGWQAQAAEMREFASASLRHTLSLPPKG